MLLVQESTRLRVSTSRIQIYIENNSMQSDISGLQFPKYEQSFYCASIGIIDGHTRLRCTINLADKSLRYHQNRNQVFEVIKKIENKLLKAGFNRLIMHSRLQMENFSTDFLPGELLKGNPKVIPAFLQQLKNQRVQSYIKFKMNKAPPNSRSVYKLASLLIKLTERRKVLGLHKITEQYERVMSKINKDLVLYQLKYTAEDSEKSEIQPAYTPEKSRHKNVHISYVKINLTPEKDRLRKSTRSQPNKRRKMMNFSIKDLQKSSEKREYIFSSVDNKLRTYSSQYSAARQ